MSEESKESEIKAGDIVQLKSGSHNMTVQLIKGVIASLVWCNTHSIETAQISVYALKKVGD